MLLDRLLPTGELADDGELASWSFVEARGRPEAFLRWRERTLLEQRRSVRNTIPDPRGINPRIPRPASEGRYFDSRWWINSLGFRGPEISRAKGARYRVVALGESTTFGSTLEATDRPWPEVLEQRIAAEYACDKPVRVVNAGVPGWNLANQLARLPLEILPLDRDLILSYHGYNGFPYILRQIPPVNVGRRPEAPPRPSRFLARVETWARLAWFKRRYRTARTIDASVLEMDVLLSRYAELYQELVTAARSRGIDVVLCTFNMAVTPESPEEVIRFYEPVFPDLRAQVLANRLHTRLVLQLAETYQVVAIDTSEGLDGAYAGAYVDPIHFTQLGRDRLAENILGGIRPILTAESPGCRPRVP